MSEPLTADRKSCPHGHALRRKCSLCDYADMAEDCQELMAERDALTQKVCELITQRQQAQHERDCAVEEVARLNRENNQFREAMHYPMSSEGAEIMRIFDVTITRVVHTRTKEP